MQHFYDYHSFPTIIANIIPYIPIGYANRQSFALGVGLGFALGFALGFYVRVMVMVKARIFVCDYSTFAIMVYFPFQLIPPSFAILVGP